MEFVIAGIGIAGIVVLAVGGVLYDVYKGRKDIGIK